jgi:hypothetical protein
MKEQAKILEKLENDQRNIMQKVNWREMRRMQMLKGVKNYSVSLQEQYNDYDRIIGNYSNLMVENSIKRKEELDSFREARELRKKQDLLKSVKMWNIKKIKSKN